MNKTVNINLAGTFFHIDENAFGKLQRYLSAIKRSLTEPQGSDEIMRDIEARISELFSEKIETNAQVISIKELDEVISVMGQPEDYSVDEELFEEESQAYSRPRTTASYKQLYRDIDNKFVSGVSSGLGHYLKIDAIWVRLIWILLTFLTSGIAIPIYILFWILVPAAVTTSEKLKMMGEPINISNIEKKFKEGYETVADRVKNADYDKYGQKIKSGSSSFFSGLGSILLTLLTIFVKLFGLLLIFVSLTTLISLVVGLFFFGSIDFWGSGEMMDYIAAYMDGSMAPLWLISTLIFLVIGIPFFVLFVLGLKIMINNLKSIGTPAKIILVVVWITSIIGLSVVGVKMATEQAYDNEIKTEYPLNIKSGDTLRLKMQEDDLYHSSVYRSNGFEIQYNENDEKIIYSNDIRLIVRSTKDSTATLSIERSSEGNSLLNAKKRAEAITYRYDFTNNELSLDSYFITAIENGYRDQEVEVILYMPEGSVLFADENTYSFHSNSSYYEDILDNDFEGYHLLIQNKKTECLDCPPKIEAEAETQSELENRMDKILEENNSENWEEEVKNDFVDDESQIPTTELNEVQVPTKQIPKTPINKSTTDSLTFKNNTNENT